MAGLISRKNIKKMLKVFYVICGLLVLVDFMVHRHIYHDLGKHPCILCHLWFYWLCCFWVLIATEMRKFLMRGEDYYDE